MTDLGCRVQSIHWEQGSGLWPRNNLLCLSLLLKSESFGTTSGTEHGELNSGNKTIHAICARIVSLIKLTLSRKHKQKMFNYILYMYSLNCVTYQELYKFDGNWELVYY